MKSKNDLDALHDDPSFVDTNGATTETTPDDSELDDAYPPVDPIDEEIAAYLDDELEPEERKSFEEKLSRDPELKARVDAERSAWDALEALDEPESPSGLMEDVVERLNSETKTELETIEKEFKRRRILFALCAVAVAATFFGGSFLLFNALFPDLNTRRERDFRVVERLAQLEAVDGFEYASALLNSGLLKKYPPEAQRLVGRGANGFERDGDKGDSEPKTYRELSQDRAFYRLQRQFENLDKSTQKRLRDLYAQIDAAPNASKLWATLDAYELWRTSALSDAEQDRIEKISIEERLDLIRAKQAMFERMQDFSLQAQRGGSWNARQDWRLDAPNRQPGRRGQPFGAPGARPNESSPGIFAFRLTLPEQLRGEDLHRVFQEYDQYRKKLSRTDPKQSQSESVLTFVSDITQDKLNELLSDEALEYLATKSESERASALGMLVSLSWLENADFARRSFDPSGAGRADRNAQDLARRNPPENNPPGQRRRDAPMRPNAQGGAPQPSPFGARPFNQPFMFGSPRNFGIGGPGFYNHNVNSLRDLADSLHNAPDGLKDYITSSPPQTAWSALLGYHWNRRQAERRVGPFGAPPQRNRQREQFGPRDAGESRDEADERPTTDLSRNSEPNAQR